MTGAGRQGAESDGPERTAGRRLVLGGGLAALAAGATLGASGRASAAPPTAPWLLGGNTGVSTDGSNYLGPRNVAPLVFKTAAVDATPLERMRITPTGRVGIGTGTPASPLHVRAANGIAIRGHLIGGSVANVAVHGLVALGTGVAGRHASTTGSGPGVLGETDSRSGNAAGVVGRVNPTDPGASSGVWGINNGTGPSGVGVYGTHAGAGYGVLGSSPDGIGVYGTSNEVGVRGDGSTGVHGTGELGVVGEGSDEGVIGRGQSGVSAVGIGVEGIGIYATGELLAGEFDGDVGVGGTLFKSAGSFRIDHPLDPEEKWLSHSFVESPDMMNVYNGTVVLGADGTASVELPAYFAALNRDYRYQLTPVGGAAPDLHVAERVAGNRFAIAGGPAGLEVSWQVTGIRQDTYAREHPIVVERAKTDSERAPRRRARSR